MNFYTEQEQTHRHRKQTYGYQREKEEDGETRSGALSYPVMIAELNWKKNESSSFLPRTPSMESLFTTAFPTYSSPL